MPPTAPVVEEKRSFIRSTTFKILVGLVVLSGFVVFISKLDLKRDLSRLHVSVLSGAPEGNYHSLVDKMHETAAKQRGSITNVASDGSLDNIRRLAAAGTQCDVQYGLVQDGLDFAPGLQLVGRLPRMESVFLLGKNADKIPGFAGMAHMKIGIGPEGSGTARLAREIFDSEDFRELELRLSNHTTTEQLELAARGDLDLAMFVIDEDSQFISDAVRKRGLQIVGLPHADVVARRIPHLKTGRIGGGQYDAVRMLPADDKKVLRVETLVISNGCAGRSQTIELMNVLSQNFPEFIRHNRETPNTSGLEFVSTAQTYIEHQGPDWVDEYMPWVEDLMPLGNWVYVVTGISILFNAMGFGHRFRLWRIDANRVKLELELEKYFGEGITLGDLSRLEPSSELLRPEVREGVRSLIAQLQALASKARKQSLSMLVPMGQEMSYRYQEDLIKQTIAVLRGFIHRCEEVEKGGPATAA